MDFNTVYSDSLTRLANQRASHSSSSSSSSESRSGRGNAHRNRTTHTTSSTASATLSSTSAPAVGSSQPRSPSHVTPLAVSGTSSSSMHSTAASTAATASAGGVSGSVTVSATPQSTSAVVRTASRAQKHGVKRSRNDFRGASESAPSANSVQGSNKNDDEDEDDNRRYTIKRIKNSSSSNNTTTSKESTKSNQKRGARDTIVAAELAAEEPLSSVQIYFILDGVKEAANRLGLTVSGSVFNDSNLFKEKIFNILSQMTEVLRRRNQPAASGTAATASSTQTATSSCSTSAPSIAAESLTSALNRLNTAIKEELGVQIVHKASTATRQKILDSIDVIEGHLVHRRTTSQALPRIEM